MSTADLQRAMDFDEAGNWLRLNEGDQELLTWGEGGCIVDEREGDDAGSGAFDCEEE